MADQGSQGLLSWFLRWRRMRVALPHLRGRVLDFGSGSGSLAAFVDAGRYTGIDIDNGIVETARKRYPDHVFHAGSTPPAGPFDTVVSLAVIEHMENPAGFLMSAKGCLAPEGAVVLTTPHPDFHAVHDIGARIGLFSHAASEEHQALLDPQAMCRLAIKCGFAVVTYRRFLLGANQLFLLRRDRFTA